MVVRVHLFGFPVVCYVYLLLVFCGCTQCCLLVGCLLTDCLYVAGLLFTFVVVYVVSLT